MPLVKMQKKLLVVPRVVRSATWCGVFCVRSIRSAQRRCSQFILVFSFEYNIIRYSYKRIGWSGLTLSWFPIGGFATMDNVQIIAWMSLDTIMEGIYRLLLLLNIFCWAHSNIAGCEHNNQPYWSGRELGSVRSKTKNQPASSAECEIENQPQADWGVKSKNLAAYTYAVRKLNRKNLMCAFVSTFPCQPARQELNKRIQSTRKRLTGN